MLFKLFLHPYVVTYCTSKKGGLQQFFINKTGQDHLLLPIYTTMGKSACGGPAGVK
jgi:hypothetical protein